MSQPTTDPSQPEREDDYNSKQPRIRGITCPACGCSDTIFIGSGGYLTCSWIECPEPELQAAIKLHEQEAVINILEKLKRYDNAYYGHITGMSAHYPSVHAVPTSVIDAEIAAIQTKTAGKS